MLQVRYLLLVLLALASPALTWAGVSIHVNAGGTPFTDSSGIVWSGDSGFTTGSVFDWGGVAIAGAADPTLYRTERYAPALHYAFNVPNGNYRVKLHFAENYFNTSWPGGGVGQRLFDVRLEGVTLLSNVDVLATAGAHTAWFQILNTTVSDGQLNLDLIAKTNNALLNGIEIDEIPTVDVLPPTVPTGLAGLAVNAVSVSLTWNASSDAGSGVSGYNIYRNGTFVGTSVTTQFTDASASPNTAYSYAVSATDSATPANESQPSAAVNVTTPVASSGGSALYRLDIGTTAAVVDGNGNTWSGDQYGTFGAYLDWHAAGFADLTGTPYATIFRTERYSPPVVPGLEMMYDLPVPNGTYDVRLYFAEHWVTGPGQRRFGVSVNGSTFYTDVFAEAGGQGIPLIKTTRVTVTTGVISLRFLRDIENPFVNGIEVVPVSSSSNPTPPGAPTNVSATIEGGFMVRLHWLAPNNTGSGLAGYFIRRNGAALPNVSASATATDVLDSDTLKGTTYHYTVSAYDSSGNQSVQSAEAVITIPGSGCPGPSQVTGLAATAVTSYSISLQWNPATDNCVGLQKSYVVAHEYPGHTDIVATLGGTTTQYGDTGLTAGTTYTILVAACHLDITVVCGAYSDPLVVTTPPDTIAPTTPTGITATPLSSTSIQVSWNPSSDASGIAGYRLYHVADGSLVAFVTATSYIDNGLTPTLTYGYYVLAVDTAAAANASATSANAFATTPAAGGSQTAWRINAGGLAYVDSAAASWSADYDYGISSFYDWGNIPIGGTNDPALYRTERYSPALHYGVPVPNGTYRIRLFFAENYFDSGWPAGGVGQRVFDVRIENVLQFANLDVLAAVGAHSALIKSVDVTVSDGQLNIDLIAKANNALLNAIEITQLSGVSNDKVAPTIPSNLNAVAASSSAINLIWTGSTDSGAGLAGYKIYRNGSYLTSTANTSYQDTGLNAGTLYSYTVSAYDLAAPANESNPSTGASATTKSTGSGGGVAQVYQCNDAGASGRWATDTNSLNQDVTMPNCTNMVAVAYNTAALTLQRWHPTDHTDPWAIWQPMSILAPGWSVWTPDGWQLLAQLQARPDSTAPSVPSNVIATAASTNTISLSWSASTDPGANASGVAGYKVYRDALLLAVTTATTIADVGLPSGTQYGYAVSSYDSAAPANESAISPSVTATTASAPGPQNPVSLKLWAPAAGVTPNSGNYVYLQSDSGDYIGQGATYLYTQANAILTVSGAPEKFILAVQGDQSWNGSLQGPDSGAQMQVGYFGNLKRFPFRDVLWGGLDWSSESRGCNTLTGWFVVDSVSYSGSSLAAIDLRFEQHCEGAAQALHGKIHWRSDDATQPPGPVSQPSGLWTPSAGVTPGNGNYIYLQSDSGDFIGAGKSYLYTPSNSTTTLLGSGKTTTIIVGGPDSWVATFAGMNSISQLQPGYYGDLMRYPLFNPAKGGLDWSGNARGCNRLSGWFAIDDITFAGNAVSSVDLRFEQHCEGAPPALHGIIHWVN